MTTQPTDPEVPQWTCGDRLRKARVMRGYTVKEFARASLISEKTINDYENDRIERRSELRLEKWATVTNVPLVWLKEGVEPTSTPPEPEGDKEVALRKLADRKREGRHGGSATYRYPITAVAA